MKLYFSFIDDDKSEFNEIGENMRFDDFVWAREPDKYVVDGNPVALNHNNICVNTWWCN